MEISLLVIAIAFACLFAGIAIYCSFQEATEAWAISHLGWAAGHRRHRHELGARKTSVGR